VDGRLVTETWLVPPAVIRLGGGGLELRFELEDEIPSARELTAVLPMPSGGRRPTSSAPPASAAGLAAGDQDAIVDAAVQEAREARDSGLTDQTSAIMRKMLGKAVRRSSRKFKTTIAALVVALVALGGAGYWRIAQLEAEKRDVDRHIKAIRASSIGWRCRSRSTRHVPRPCRKAFSTGSARSAGTMPSCSPRSRR
jgi:hypothetical protein